MTKDELIEQFVRAAEKQRFALNNGGFGHAGWCNFQRPHTECPRCNCGISDLQTTLDNFNKYHLRGYKLKRIKNNMKK